MTASSRARWLFSCGLLQIADALQGAEDFVADLGLDADEVEGGYVDGASGAHALAGDVEELPVEIEAFVGAEKVAGEDEVDEEFFADAEGIELLGGDGHQRAGRADDQRGHAGEARGDGVGKSIAIERRDVGGAEVDEGQDDDAVVLFVAEVDARLAEALGEHGEDAGGALLFLGCLEGETALRGSSERDSPPGMRTESSCMDRMIVLSDSRTSAAEEKRAEGCFSRQRRMTLSSSTGRSELSRGWMADRRTGWRGWSGSRARRGGGRGGGRWRARRG